MLRCMMKYLLTSTLLILFYSYDNERSIKDKCEYVKNNNLGGLMCWDLTQDYVDNEGTYVLLNSMYVNLKKDENSAE